MKKLTQFIGEFMENKKEINCWNIPTKVREKMVEDFAKGLYYAQNLPFFSYAFSYRTLPDSVKKDIKRIRILSKEIGNTVDEAVVIAFLQSL